MFMDTKDQNFDLKYTVVMIMFSFLFTMVNVNAFFVSKYVCVLVTQSLRIMKRFFVKHQNSGNLTIYSIYFSINMRHVQYQIMDYTSDIHFLRR